MIMFTEVVEGSFRHGVAWEYRMTARRVQGQKLLDIRTVYYNEYGDMTAIAGHAEVLTTGSVERTKALLEMVEVAMTKPEIDLDNNINILTKSYWGGLDELWLIENGLARRAIGKGE